MSKSGSASERGRGKESYWVRVDPAPLSDGVLPNTSVHACVSQYFFFLSHVTAERFDS
jgi:hypothetical protein